MLLGGLLVFTGHEAGDDLHYLYGVLPLLVSLFAEGPAPAPPSGSSATLDFEALPEERQRDDRAGDRPPRDGDHGGRPAS